MMATDVTVKSQSLIVRTRAQEIVIKFVRNITEILS